MGRLLAVVLASLAATAVGAIGDVPASSALPTVPTVPISARGRWRRPCGRVRGGGGDDTVAVAAGDGSGSGNADPGGSGGGGPTPPPPPPQQQQRLENPADWRHSLNLDFLPGRAEFAAIMPLVLSPVLFSLCEASAVVASGSQFLSHDSTGLNVLGVLLSLTTVFRTQQAYSRYWEARGHLGQVAGGDRSEMTTIPSARG